MRCFWRTYRGYGTAQRRRKPSGAHRLQPFLASVQQPKKLLEIIDSSATGEAIPKVLRKTNVAQFSIPIWSSSPKADQYFQLSAGVITWGVHMNPGRNMLQNRLDQSIIMTSLRIPQILLKDV